MNEHTQALQPYKIRAIHPSTEEIKEALLYPEHFGGRDAIRFPSDGMSPPYHLADDLEWEYM